LISLALYVICIYSIISGLICFVVLRWWAPSKFDPIRSPMLFFEKGRPIVPTLLPPAGLDLALQNMVCL
jgi:hypothetical protein